MKPNPEITSLLLRTAKAHAQIIGGHNRYDDPNWPEWFAEFLINQTDFSTHTNRDWNKEDLATALLDLDHSYHNKLQKLSWAAFYAQRLTD